MQDDDTQRLHLFLVRETVVRPGARRPENFRIEHERHRTVGTGGRIGTRFPLTGPQRQDETEHRSHPKDMSRHKFHFILPKKRLLNPDPNR